ncbi:hypothetical protein KH5_15800 [Urechidicola sp. KH5]
MKTIILPTHWSIAAIAIFLVSLNSFAFQLDFTIETENTTLSGTTVVSSTRNNGDPRINASNNTMVTLNTTGSSAFTVTGVPSVGTYKLRIYHFNNGTTQDASLTVNGTTQNITLLESNFEYEDTAKFTDIDINLNAGANTISISHIGAGGSALILDYFNVSSPYNVYYISNDGDDSNDGLTPATAWETYTNVNAALATNNNGGYATGGDQFLFKSGDTFIGQLLVNRSGDPGNPIVISNYGVGNLPILTGADASIQDYVHAIKLTNTSNIILSNLAIQNDRLENDRYAVWQEENSYGILCLANKWGGITSNMVFRNLEITNILSVTIPDPSDFNGFKVTGIYFESAENHDGSTSPAATDVGFDNVLIEDCYFSNTGKAGVQAIHKGDWDATNTDWGINRNSNFIIKNNHFYRTGGSGIILSKMHNALVENNNFDQTGYDATPNNDADFFDDRLANRGSGMWVFRCKNVIAQYNRAYGAHGSNDSYGMHIDFGNEDIIYQYNYSEMNEGFVEILGENNRCTYRFNVSVNDGDRPTKGYTFWVSQYAGTGNDVSSNNSYIYNNTVYLDKNFSPDIKLYGKNIYVYNNILIEDSPSGVIGQSVDIQIDNGFQLDMSHNIWRGNVSTNFRNGTAPRWSNTNWSNSNPQIVNAGATSESGYNINNSSGAIDQGRMFTQPPFAAGGNGIFANIPVYPTEDIFGNTVDIATYPPNIGASNNFNSNSVLGVSSFEETTLFGLYPNPVKDKINLNLSQELNNPTVHVFDVMGKQVYMSNQTMNQGVNLIDLPSNIRNGIYFLKLTDTNKSQTEQFILYR